MMLQSNIGKFILIGRKCQNGYHLGLFKPGREGWINFRVARPTTYLNLKEAMRSEENRLRQLNYR